MASLRGVFSEGSLLRRTLVHVATFAIGTLAFVGLLSFLLVSLATSLLPSQTPKAGADPTASADPTDDESSSSAKAASAKLPKVKKPRGGIAQSESPTRDSEN